jgi:MYXO-CTERM domain-containing protein
VTGNCGGTGTHALIHQAVDWIEENSGYDITPCHDSGGVWNPTFDCGGFFMGGATGYGTWTNWCPGTPASDSNNTCGQPFDNIPDNDPPLVQITSPMDGDEFMDEIPAKIPIEVATDDGDGWGVKSVRFKINGEEQPVEDFDPPFAFNGAAFPEGVWTLQAIAEDAAGLIGESPEVTIIVGDPPAVTTSGGETTGGEGTTGGPGTTGDGGTSAGTAGTAGTSGGVGTSGLTGFESATATATAGETGTGQDEEDGCGCRTGDGRGSLLGLAFGLLGLPLLRRRRR